MLGSGGLLGNDVSLNLKRADDAQHPEQMRTRTSRSALGAVAPPAGAVAIQSLAAPGATGEPAMKKIPGPFTRSARTIE